MNYKRTLLFLLVAGFLITLWYLGSNNLMLSNLMLAHNEEKVMITKGDNVIIGIGMEQLMPLLLSAEGVASADELGIPPIFIHALLNKPKRSAISFVELPIRSGTGGRSGYIFLTALRDGWSMIITDFFSHLPSIRATAQISTNGDYLSYEAVNSSGANCQFYGAEIINLIGRSEVSLNPPGDTPDYYETKEDKYRLNEVVKDIRWLNDNTISFKKYFQNCEEKIPLSSIETWQYNTETGEYKLIK